MITSSRKADFATKEEGDPNDGKISKASTSSTSWLRSKDPRIVRVSRAFGGKDRHSKVCTVRGLRDRRVRLSVPTAIQLYDLQDRLGLNQPSKVVDWLINAAKHDIDQLPPLQMPPGNFGQFHQPFLINPSQSDKGGPKNNYWISDIKSKEVARARIDEKGKQSDVEGHGSYISSNNFFSRINHPSLPGLLNQQSSSFLRWDPNSDLSLSNFGSHGLAPEVQELHGFNVVQPLPFPSNLSMPFPTATTTQSYFPSYVNASGEFDPKQINFQMLSSTSQNPLYSMSQATRPFQLSMTPPKLFPSRDDSGSEPNKDN